MKLSTEQVQGLQSYVARAGRGRLVIMPFVCGSSGYVHWQARLYARGMGGWLKPTEQNLEALNMPKDWAEKAEKFVETMQGSYPALQEPEFVERQAANLGLPGKTETETKEEEG